MAGQAVSQIGTPIFIRYDGLDADAHVVEISDLATSLKGLGRILTVVGTFAVNQKLMERSSARPVRIVAGPPRDGCVTFQLAMTWLDQHQFIGATVSGMAVLLVGYVFKRAAGQKEEMKHLREALEVAIRELGHRDEPIIARLLDTVDRMADVLKPAARQAVAPVGRTAGTLTVGEGGSAGRQVVVDKAERDAIDAASPIEIGPEETIGFLFTEMNLDSRTCKVSTDLANPARYAADITDPEILTPHNAYADAFAAQRMLTVRAKPTLRDGAVERWYISAHS